MFILKFVSQTKYSRPFGSHFGPNFWLSVLLLNRCLKFSYYVSLISNLFVYNCSIVNMIFSSNMDGG